MICLLAYATHQYLAKCPHASLGWKSLERILKFMWQKKTNLLNPSPRSLRVMWRVYVCVLRLEISSNIAPCLGELFTRNLSSGWVSSTVKEFTKAKNNEKKKYPENVPFLIMMLFEEHDKN